MHIIIRAANQNDAQAISQLSTQLGYTMSATQTSAQVLAVNASTNDVAYVAVDADRIVGWIHIFYTLRLECPPYCEIGGLVVDEAYRGRGVGKMLIEHAKPWCREKGCGKLKVRSNAKRNDAHRFYEQAGFREIKQQKVFETIL